MGNTFDNMIDFKALGDLKIYIHRINDWSKWMPEHKEEKKFWYLAVPITGDNDSNWECEGKVSEIKMSIKKQLAE